MITELLGASLRDDDTLLCSCRIKNSLFPYMCLSLDLFVHELSPLPVGYRG